MGTLELMGKSEPRKLTAKQEKFCQLYTKHWNATKAAREAGYSDESASERGYELRQKPSVQARIAELTEHALSEIGVTRERVLAELSKLAFSNMKDFAEWGPNGISLKHSQEMDDDHGACIQELSETVTEHGGSTRFKLYDKVRALELLGKYQKLFAERVEHSGPNGKPIEHKDVSDLPDDQLEAMIQRLLEKVPAK